MGVINSIRKRLSFSKSIDDLGNQWNSMSSFADTGMAMEANNAFANAGSVEWMKQYHQNPRLAVANKIATDNGTTKYGIYLKDKKSHETLKVEGHPLEKELNKFITPQFFAYYTAGYLMSGKVYIAFKKDTKAGPYDIKLFLSHHVQVDPTQGVEGDPKGNYKFQVGEDTYTYPVEDVIVDLDLDLIDPYKNGKGKALSLARDLEMDSLIVSYLTAFYFNSTRPDYFIIPKTGNGQQNIPEEKDLKRVMEGLKSFHQGSNNSHRAAALGFEASIVVVEKSHKDMELLETRRDTRKIANQHFGVPPELMGDVENSNKATVIAAQHIYATQVRLPLLRHFENVLTHKLLPLYDDFECYFEFENIIPDNYEEGVKIASEMRESGAFQVNEYRAKLGYPPLKGEFGKHMIGTTPWLVPRDPNSPNKPQEEVKAITDPQEEMDTETRREREGRDERTPGDTSVQANMEMISVPVEVASNVVAYEVFDYQAHKKAISDKVKEFTELDNNTIISIKEESEQ